MSAVTSNAFNASIVITELLAKTLENCAKDLSIRCITECARRHGFDASEEIRVLGLENLALIKRQMAKKTASKEPKEKKEKKAKPEKSAKFPLPFIPSLVNQNGCNGLTYNHGLFTQCSKTRMETGNFCAKCQVEADKNASGCPDAGSIQQRLSDDFADSKNRKPVHYLKVLKKMNKTAEEAIVFAQQNHIVIPEYHLTAIEETTTRGRPKKSTTVVTAVAVPDLFAMLTKEAENNTAPTPTPTITAPTPAPETSKKVKLTDEQKAAKKADKEKERNDKKLQKEQEDKAKKDKAEKEKKERESKKEQERLEKEATKKAKEEAKKAKEAEKEAEKARKTAEKEAKKSGKAVASTPAPVTPAPVTPAPTPTPDADAPTNVALESITINGIEYMYDSETNYVYPVDIFELDDQEPIGTYDKENNMCVPLDNQESDEDDDMELDAESVTSDLC
jgi:Skp family chaperone for outer membrane proteins